MGRFTGWSIIIDRPSQQLSGVASDHDKLTPRLFCHTANYIEMSAYEEHPIEVTVIQTEDGDGSFLANQSENVHFFITRPVYK